MLFNLAWLVALLTIEILQKPSFCSQVPSNEVLYVHLIPHSHDDVGWKETVDVYYERDVRGILSTVLSQLLLNSDRKFIPVEMAYFSRWWNELTPTDQGNVRELVKSGQLEFTNGGWCMNDEGATHYNAIIDQMSLGLRFIERTFGPQARPRAAWHIDPFGHSAAQATLFAKMGFDSFFFSRVDRDDKSNRIANKTLEMVWQGSSSLKNKSDIFTSVFWGDYYAPKGFCFDITCSDPEINDGIHFNNVNDRVTEFISTVKTRAAAFKTNNLMVTMGGDFMYQSAWKWYTNMDKLIKYVNQNSSGQVLVMYSTPSLYVKYLHKLNETWPQKTDDFFPYADHLFSYWTGYFTSRPNFKGYVRKLNNLLQACKQLEALHNGFPSSKFSSRTLQEAMAVAQHHDAITGTEKQHVVEDYAEMLHAGQVDCTELIGQAINDFAAKGSPSLNLEHCEYLNISVCNASENNLFDLVVYNPLARNWTGVLRVPVNTTSISVTGPLGTVIPTQIIPVSQATRNVRRNKGYASYELVVGVHAENAIPPLGYKMFFIRNAPSRHTFVSKSQNIEENVHIGNEFVNVTFDTLTGHLKSVTNIPLGISVNVDQQFFWYHASSGNNTFKQSSGAYIFKPAVQETEALPVSPENKAQILNVYKGMWVEEVHQSFTDWITQVVRVYKGIPGVELEYTVGPIPVNDKLGKEIISHFSSKLASNQTWYTDSNGREMQQRRQDFRPTWKLNVSMENISRNYFPVNSRMYIRDESAGIQLTVLTDRSQGGSSLRDGEMELMVHRRCLVDDNRGVEEPLDEKGQYGEGLITRGKHHLLFDTVSNSSYWHRLLAEKMMLEPILLFSPSNSTVEHTVKNFRTSYMGLRHSFPKNTHLLTLEYLEANKMLLRLENQFEAKEPVVGSLNSEVTINLNEVLSDFEVKNFTELTLGGNAPRASVARLKWNVEGSVRSGDNIHVPMMTYPPSMNITLAPMDIRTFNITVNPL